MRRLRTLVLLTMVSVTVLAGACSKGGVVDEPHLFDASDTSMPLLILSSPGNNQVFNSGEVIRVTGTVTDNSLYDGSIRITDDADGKVVKEQQYQIHSLQSYDFNFQYTATVSVVTNYTVTVQYEDHGLNNVVQSVKIKVNP